MSENCKQEKVFIKAHFPRRPQEIYMVESNERVEREAPILYKVLKAIAMPSQVSQRKLQSLRHVIGSAGAMLLKARNAQMSAVQHLVTLSLFLDRTRKKVCFKILIS